MSITLEQIVSLRSPFISDFINHPIKEVEMKMNSDEPLEMTVCMALRNWMTEYTGMLIIWNNQSRY
jgi:hypothetical protein